MQMTFRWYGEGNDKIKLSDIKQIPGVSGIVWALHHKMPGNFSTCKSFTSVYQTFYANLYIGIS